MMARRTLPLLLALPLFAVASVSAGQSRCSDFDDCDACTRQSAWLGLSCRWCPIDRACHQPLSPKNSCADEHNAVQPEHCEPPPPQWPRFNRTEAEFAAFMAGAAYAPDPARCAANFAKAEITEVTRVEGRCDFFRDQCVAFFGRLPSRHQLVLGFRGTRGSSQLLLEGLMSLAAPKQTVEYGGKVQRYFSDAFGVLWPLVRPGLLDLLAAYPSHPLLIVGHSLGGAVAAMAAMNLVWYDQIPGSRLQFFSFGEPRVGDYDFARAFDRLVPYSWRVVHARDVVPHLPICSPVYQASPFSCSSHFGFPYHHGNEVYYPPDARMLPGSSHWRLCRGTPVNEDAECANNPDNWEMCMNPLNTASCVNDHLVYYGIHVGKWWEVNQCTGLTE